MGLLEQRISELTKARAWSPFAVRALEKRLREGDDAAVFRINPMRFAKETGVAEDEAVDLLLHAAKVGLVEMTWGLLCPVCGDTLKTFVSLKTVEAKIHCNLCSRGAEASLDDLVQVAFTVAQDLRDVKYRRPEALEIVDWLTHCRFATRGFKPDGTSYGEEVMRQTRHLGYLEPGASVTVAFDAVAGIVRAYDLIDEVGYLLPVRPGGVAEVEGTFGSGKLAKGAAEIVAPGRVKLTFSNPTKVRRALLVVNFRDGHMPGLQTFEPFLTGRRTLASQTFRDLFRSESIGASEPLGVKDLTFLFTDLKGSTDLYGRIGDLKAFQLVRRHFESLGKAIQANRGSLVKTIGDAVMATFLSPGDAVRAALEMLREIGEFNRAQGEDDLILKIGVHNGAAIAVTMNERLDYFGQTVNIAARVQGLAHAEEICLTEESYADPAVRAVLQGCALELESATLKGVDGARAIYRVRPPRGVKVAA